jgi:selenocysteine-specific elongation factor
VQHASAGQRTAVALTGQEIEREALARGQALVVGEAWGASTVMTARVRVLADSAWALERGQRVRVHLGTAERIARLVLLETDALLPGEEGWAQLRLEAPAIARARERFVIRAYSPLATLGGGVVAEPMAGKRTRLGAEDGRWLAAVLEGDVGEAVAARAALSGWPGEATERLAVTTGFSPDLISATVGGWSSVGAEPVGGEAERPYVLPGALISPAVAADAGRRLLAFVDAFHAANPLRLGPDVESLRQSFPSHAHSALADGLLGALVARGQLTLRDGVVARPDFQARPSAGQEKLLGSLAEAFRAAALSPPALTELPAQLRDSADLWPLLKMLEADGRLTRIDTELFIWSEALAEASQAVRRLLGGRSGLGPADFKDAVPVTRKHLLPILLHFDQVGVTSRRGNTRDVPAQ